MKSKPCKYCESTMHLSSWCFFKPPRTVKPCQHCGERTHFNWQCFKNPKRKEQMASKLKNGKAVARWLVTRRQWFIQNHAESYNCHYCGKYLLKNEVTLDHYIPRSRRPDLRYVLSNLVPCCFECNGKKGSQDGDRYTAYLQSLSQADKKGV